MRRIILATVLTCLALGPALAEVECKTPMDDWQPVAALKAAAEKLGLTVQRIRADDGCYHVKATDKTGKAVEVVFDPQTLTLLESSEKDLEKGDHTEGDADTPTLKSAD
jgi:hypothetical protein